MVSKKGSLIIAAIVATLFLFTAAWTSCTKPLDNYKYSCSGVVCSNGGHCDSARCFCPVGYEGPTCATASVNKFYGTYRLNSLIIGSDSVAWVGRDTVYNVLLRYTATPTTFFMNNFAGDPFYSNIVCTLDSINNYNFAIDTISRTNMVYDHYRILGGYGHLEGDSITARIWIRHLNDNVNWQNDTLLLGLKKNN
jgi:hypothetical protein